MVLKSVREYFRILQLLPTLDSDVLQRIIEILKVITVDFTHHLYSHHDNKLFNSRTCQLVLGGGAIQMMNFKTITAKHLAVASRSIALQMALIPHIKKVTV
jgi:vacuolar protein sorting-associated protein 54